MPQLQRAQSMGQIPQTSTVDFQNRELTQAKGADTNGTLARVNTSSAEHSPKADATKSSMMRNAIDSFTNKTHINFKVITNSEHRKSGLDRAKRAFSQAKADYSAGGVAKQEVKREALKNGLKLLLGTGLSAAGGAVLGALPGGLPAAGGAVLGTVFGPLAMIASMVGKSAHKIGAQDALQVHGGGQASDQMKKNADIHTNNRTSLDFAGLGHRIQNESASAVANAFKANQSSDGADKLQRINLKGNRSLDEQFVGNLIHGLTDGKASIKDDLVLNLKHTNVYHGADLKDAIKSGLQDADTGFDSVSLSRNFTDKKTHSQFVTANLTNSQTGETTAIQLKVSKKFDMNSTRPINQEQTAPAPKTEEFYDAPDIPTTTQTQSA
ncbi:MAG: hypothetical protein CMD81_15145 [Gammaproteobacteria bacterium]|nr:hypothetical protein [Gammaproteobacteria bacterium]HBF07797.1 hypothetical protein [Gammaproteobacteria bacterium]|tara:strand:+ start:3556 stop:4701 length:1146 start_codon:yes stop_codon:yes gene_type:complete